MAGRLPYGLPKCVDVTEASKTMMDIVKEKIAYQDEEGIEDPFAVFNLTDIIAKHDKWMRLFPRVTPFYAVKCCDDEVLLRLLASLGTNFDCASKNEITKVLDIGVSPDRIIYANTCKQRDMLAFARDCGVRVMTFDNEEELYKVKDVSPTAELLLRIRPPETDKLFRKMGIKFGCPPQQTKTLLETAKSLGLNVIGISYHIGSGCYDIGTFCSAVITAASAADVAREVGFSITVLDIGGGFPGRPDSEISMEDIATAMVLALDEYFPESSGVRIVAEPGRFFVASAVMLTAKVIGKRLDYDHEFPAAVQHNGSASVFGAPSFSRYYINDGIHGSFLPYTLGNRVHSPIVLSSRPQSHLSQKPERMLPSTVYGPTCDGHDVVIERIDLPETYVDDWMSFSNEGAYSLCLANGFNGMPKPRLYYVIFANDRYWAALTC